MGLFASNPMSSMQKFFRMPMLARKVESGDPARAAS
jgi:hypothetical protein